MRAVGSRSALEAVSAELLKALFPRNTSRQGLLAQVVLFGPLNKDESDAVGAASTFRTRIDVLAPAWR